jgi:hypothetical protein
MFRPTWSSCVKILVVRKLLYPFGLILVLVYDCILYNPQGQRPITGGCTRAWGPQDNNLLRTVRTTFH